MKRTLTLIAAALAMAASLAAQAECSGSTCVGHKSKFEAAPATAPVQP